MTILAACAAFFASLLSPAVALAGTLDQGQTDTIGFQYQIGVIHSVAQTFTAGLSGGLDQVDLNLEESGTPSADLNVEIRDVVGGDPGSVVLATSYRCELIHSSGGRGKSPQPAFSSCGSPKTFGHLKAGRYTFEVQGINLAGTGGLAARKFEI